MEEILAKAVEKLQEKMPQGFDGSVKFEIADAGSILLDSDGARAGEGDADCTLSADAETFAAILDGTLNPTSAFMGGRLQVDGDMGMAMRLAGTLA
jgi:putative sterol carrier protein